ncbi:phosphate transporter PhoU [Thermococcus indicus]|uniref:Phosphate transporter PhoU n=1 Tax=Thermococcus indicus TaxID=2586643 RepID=A0A4Y5SK29_9EURY|nr:PhoU domain-containing protein [Thermococcus indicus]QDA31145.1 phosphate transporter PhoU [Thermococcus indicus]
MKLRNFARLKALSEELGTTVIEALRTLQVEARRNEYGEVEEYLWKAISIKADLQDALVESLIRYQPMARELRFVRALLDVSYDLYRISRHASRIETVLEIRGTESARETAVEALTIVLPWIETAVKALDGKFSIPAEELPFFNAEFEEFWNRNIKTEEPAVMAVMIHSEGIFNHTKHMLASAVYYVEGPKGLEKMPILLIS